MFCLLVISPLQYIGTQAKDTKRWKQSSAFKQLLETLLCSCILLVFRYIFSAFSVTRLDETHKCFSSTFHIPFSATCCKFWIDFQLTASHLYFLYLVINSLCSISLLFLCYRFQTVEKLQQSYIFIPHKFKVEFSLLTYAIKFILTLFRNVYYAY